MGLILHFVLELYYCIVGTGKAVSLMVVRLISKAIGGVDRALPAPQPTVKPIPGDFDRRAAALVSVASSTDQAPGTRLLP